MRHSRQTLPIDEFVIQLSGAPNDHVQAHVHSSMGQGHRVFPLPITMCRRQLFPLDDPAGLGRELYDLLFQDDLAMLLEETLVHRREREIRFVIKANLNDPAALALMRLPWELLHHPRERMFLFLSLQRSLVRFLDLPRPAVAMDRPERLRVLVAWANPRDLRQLDVPRELSLLASVQRDRAHIELEVLGRATSRSLLEKLQEGTFHVFHFIGHGEGTIRDGTQGALYFETETGEARAIAATELATLLTEAQPGLRTVFLNACGTSELAGGANVHPFAATASALTLRGIETVLAMQGGFPDKEACCFGAHFYRLLAQGRPVDRCVASSRIMLFAMNPERPVWAVPTLYSRQPECRLFHAGIRSSDVGASTTPISGPSVGHPPTASPGQKLRPSEFITRFRSRRFLPEAGARLVASWRDMTLATPEAALDVVDRLATSETSALTARMAVLWLVAHCAHDALAHPGLTHRLFHALLAVAADRGETGASPYPTLALDAIARLLAAVDRPHSVLPSETWPDPQARSHLLTLFEVFAHPRVRLGPIQRVWLDRADALFPGSHGRLEASLRRLELARPHCLPFDRHGLRKVLLRDATLAERFRTDPNWVRLGLVLCGGHAWHSREASGLAFDRIHRETPLARLFVEALRAGKTPVDLLPELRRLAREEPDPRRRIEADVAVTTLSWGAPDSLVMRAPQELRSDLVSRLQFARGLAGRGAGRAAALLLPLWVEASADAEPPAPKIHAALQELHPLAHFPFEQVYRPFGDSRWAALLLARLAMERSPASSHLAAVFLDTLAGRILASRDGLVPFLTRFGAWKRGCSPEVQAVRDGTREAEWYAALDAVASAPSHLNPVRGWALRHLVPEARSMGFLEDIRILTYLIFRPGEAARREVLAAIDAIEPETVDEVEPECTESSLWAVIRSISEPFRAFRCFAWLCRGQERLRELRYQALHEKLGRDFDRMVEPGHRAVAAYWMVRFAPFPARESWAVRFHAEVEHLPARRRVFLLCAAALVHRGLGLGWLASGLSAALSLPRPHLLPLLAFLHRALNRHPDAARLLAGALRRSATSAASIHVDAIYEDRSEETPSGWRTGSRCAALATLQMHAWLRGNGGRPTRSPATILDPGNGHLGKLDSNGWDRTPVDSSDTAGVSASMWIGLEQASLSVEEPNRAFFWPIAMSEGDGSGAAGGAGFLDEAGLAALLRAARSEDDEARRFAVRSLTDPFAGPVFRVSRAGPGAVEALARFYLEGMEEAPGLALVAAWSFEKLIHDDAVALQGWMKQFLAMPGSRQAAVAEVILRRIHRLEATTWPVFLQWAKVPSSELQRMWRFNLAMALTRRRIDPDRRRVLELVLTAPETPAMSTCIAVSLQQAETMVDLAKEFAADLEVDPDEAIRQAQAALVERSVLLDHLPVDEQLLQLERMGRMRLIGSEIPVHLDLAAEELLGRPKAVNLLILWLQHRIHIDPQCRHAFDLVTGDLLGILDAFARKWPEEWRASVEPFDLLGKTLSEAASWSDWLPARQAAFRLSAALERLEDGMAKALFRNLVDVEPACIAVLVSLSGYRWVDPTAIPILLDRLVGRSAVQALAAARLSCLALADDRLVAVWRPKILRALAEAAGSERPLILPATASDDALRCWGPLGRWVEVIVGRAMGVPNEDEEGMPWFVN